MNTRREQLSDRHYELLLYQNSLCATHDRLTNAVAKSPCSYFRAVRIGRRLILRSRKNLAESTKIYQEYMASVKQERESVQR